MDFLNKKDNGKIPVTCFQEYYFIISERIIKPEVKESREFSIGKPLPVKGDTYKFPQDFNIVDLHNGSVTKIRDSKLNEMVSFNEFQYENIPAINILGAFIKISSQNDLEQFVNDFNDVQSNKEDKENELIKFANKWLVFDKYRFIKYR